jgi:hypothetical protein
MKKALDYVVGGFWILLFVTLGGLSLFPAWVVHHRKFFDVLFEIAFYAAPVSLIYLVARIFSAGMRTARR